MTLETGYLIPLTFIFGSISWRFLIATVIMDFVKDWEIKNILKPFICIHLFRYISLSLLVPGLTTVGEILPYNHVLRLAVGDVLSSLLAMASLLFLYKNWKGAMFFVVLLNVVGLLDLLCATLFDVPQFVANVGKVDTRLFSVLTTFIPLVFVSHVFMVQLLWKYYRTPKTDSE